MQFNRKQPEAITGMDDGVEIRIENLSVRFPDKSGHDQLDQLDPALVYTTGKISAHPNIHTIIPDEVKVTLDARHYDPAVIQQVLAIIHAMPTEWVGCQMHYEEAWSRKSVAYDERLVTMVANSADALGYTKLQMHSGPGHEFL